MDAGGGRGVVPGLPVGKVADVDGEQAARPQRSRDRGERLVDGVFIGQVAEHVAGRDHGIGRGQHVAGKDQQADVPGGRGKAADQAGHRRGGVGGDDAVPGGSQFPGEQAAAAAQFQDEPVPRSRRLQQRQDPRRAGPRVEAEAAVVNKREVAAVVRVFRGRCRRRPLRPGTPARVRLWFGREGYSAADPGDEERR